MQIQHSVVIITGASVGIGAATARELARLGAHVVLAARRGEELQALADTINLTGGQALAVQTDIGKREEIDRLVQRTIEAYGRIDVLVNNAGIGAGSSVTNSDDAAMRRLLDINLLGPARCIQAVLPYMQQKRSGVIINIGSVAGEVASSGLYAASKFGLRGLNDALRRELWRDNIKITLIEPGFIRTAMTADLRLPMPGPEAVARAVASAIQRPRRRIIVPWQYLPLVYLAQWLPAITDRVLGSRTYQDNTHKRQRTS